MYDPKAGLGSVVRGMIPNSGVWEGHGQQRRSDSDEILTFSAQKWVPHDHYEQFSVNLGLKTQIHGELTLS